MAVYAIVDVKIHDPAGYEQYRAGVPALIAKHGGRYLARGGATQVVEGDWTPGRIVILEFPDQASFTAFIDDPEYRPLRETRHGAAVSRIISVAGV